MGITELHARAMPPFERDAQRFSVLLPESSLLKSSALLSKATKEDLLVALAGMMEPDGGMPGETEEVRIGNSIVALLYFMREGNTSSSGPFRLHVERLLQYLNSNRLGTLSRANAEAATRILNGLVAGVSPAGDWHRYAERLAKAKMVDLHVFWRELAAAVNA